MGRNTHGNKKKKYALAAGADGEAPPVAPPAPAPEEDEELHGGADPAEAAAAAADTTPADAALISQSREARRLEKKNKRKLRLEAEAAVAAAAVAAGLEAPLSAKEARRAERRRAEEERTAARAAKQAAWLAARAEREAAAGDADASDGAAGVEDGDVDAPSQHHKPAAAAAAAHAAPVAAAAAAAAEEAPAKPAAEAKVPNTIFVGGLPFTKTPDEIRDYFGAFGEVADVDCLTFPDSGRFRGIALVRFADDAGFHAALALNGVEMEDRVLTVKRAKAKQAAIEAAGGKGPGKSAAPVAPLPLDTSSRVVYVGNLPWEVDEEVLAATFEGLPIESVTWGLDKATGDFKGYAHVAFATAEDAAAAQQRNGADVLGRPMRVAPEAKRLVPRSAGDAAAEAPAAAAAPAGGIASSTRAYVTGLPYDADSAALEAALRAAFAGCGSGPQRVRLGLDRASGAFRGYAHVDFADAAATDAAVARSGAVVCGRAVRVTRAVDKPDKLQPPKGRAGHARGRDAARSDGGEA